MKSKERDARNERQLKGGEKNIVKVWRREEWIHKFYL